MELEHFESGRSRNKEHLEIRPVSQDVRGNFAAAAARQGHIGYQQFEVQRRIPANRESLIVIFSEDDAVTFAG